MNRAAGILLCQLCQLSHSLPSSPPVASPKPVSFFVQRETNNLPLMIIIIIVIIIILLLPQYLHGHAGMLQWGNRGQALVVGNCCSFFLVVDTFVVIIVRRKEGRKYTYCVV